VDAGIKHDNAGIVAVARDGGRLVLVWHRLYKPTPAAPLDLEATVEAELLALAARYAVQAIYVDPIRCTGASLPFSRLAYPSASSLKRPRTPHGWGRCCTTCSRAGVLSCILTTSSGSRRCTR
jgi:hypothetical protein